jgi:hypothetical protein
MQQGSIIRSERKHGHAVWQFRWSETGPQDNVFTASEWSEQLKNMPALKQFVTPSRA